MLLFTNRDLRKLIIPLVIEQILTVTIGMADTVMISSVGEAAVSGVSLVDTINILIINIFTALATGGAVVSSQYIGKGDADNACLAAKQLILSTGAISLAVAALSQLFRAPLLTAIFGHVEADVFQNALVYFFFTGLSYPFIALYNSGAALFRAMGNSRISMIASLAMNMINIAGNAILIFGFGMGVAGAAIATLVSRIFGAAMMLILLKNRQNPIHVDSYRRLGFQPGMIKSIMRIGVPNGLENGMFQVGKILVQGLVASFGTMAIAANAVANSIAMVEIIPGSAIGLAMITVVGQCVGAGDFEQAHRYTLRLTKLSYLAIGALNAVMILFIRPIVGIFQLSEATMALAIQLLILHGFLTVVFWPTAFTLPNGLRAANDAKFTMLVSIFSMWSCRIGLSFLLSRGFGLGVLGVWLAMGCDWVLRAVIFTARLQSGRWKNKQYI